MHPRSAERIVRTAGQAARLPLALTAMSLRHSYAVHSLVAGVNIRALQEALGHQNIRTTLEYTRCLAPTAVSPLDQAAVPSDRTCTVVVPVLAAPSLPTGALFAAPPNVQDLHPPFPPEPTPLHRAWAYAQMLRLRLTDRFLATRRAAARGS
jgi:hypothetical protein